MRDGKTLEGRGQKSRLEVGITKEKEKIPEKPKKNRESGRYCD